MLGELVFEDTAAELLPGSSDPRVCARVIKAGRIAWRPIRSARPALCSIGPWPTRKSRAIRAAGGIVSGREAPVRRRWRQSSSPRAMLWYAAHAFDALPRKSPLNACHAKARISEVSTRSPHSTEVHGGIGFTDELGLHLWFGLALTGSYWEDPGGVCGRKRRRCRSCC